MQALKLLVSVLTILIVIVVTVIIYGMYRKSEDPDFKFFELAGDNTAANTMQQLALDAPHEGVKSDPASLKKFGEIMLSLPKGCNISKVSGDGYRIFLKVGPTGAKCERVIVINANTGAFLGTLRVNP